MTRLGIWRMMALHNPHDAQLVSRRHKPRRASVRWDEAEIVKADAVQSKQLPTIKVNDIDDKATPPPIVHTEEAQADAVTASQVACQAEEAQPQKHVSFSQVQVRTYQVILGDNPDCSFPLSLGWKYNEEEGVDVDTYESNRQSAREERRQEEHRLFALQSQLLPLTLPERRMLLRAQGHSELHLRQEERRRRVELSLQWAGGHFPKEMDFPYSQKFFLNYVL